MALVKSAMAPLKSFVVPFRRALLIYKSVFLGLLTIALLKSSKVTKGSCGGLAVMVILSGWLWAKPLIKKVIINIDRKSFFIIVNMCKFNYLI